MSDSAEAMKRWLGQQSSTKHAEVKMKRKSDHQEDSLEGLEGMVLQLSQRGRNALKFVLMELAEVQACMAAAKLTSKQWSERDQSLRQSPHGREELKEDEPWMWLKGEAEPEWVAHVRKVQEARFARSCAEEQRLRMRKSNYTPSDIGDGDLFGAEHTIH